MSHMHARRGTAEDSHDQLQEALKAQRLEVTAGPQKDGVIIYVPWPDRVSLVVEIATLTLGILHKLGCAKVDGFVVLGRRGFH